MKVLLLANSDWNLYNFRLPLARALRDAGARVLLASPGGPYGAMLRDAGFRWIPVPMVRRSLNPFREASLFLDLVRLYRQERPDVVHHFTIKGVVHGGLAAGMAGIERRINAVTGLGYVFTDTHCRARLLRPAVRALLRLSLAGRSSRLILQNLDDVREFTRAGLAPAGRIRLIPGSGVDTSRFRPREEIAPRLRPCRALLAARLLWDKGVGEYAEAARRLKQEGMEIEFLLAGEPDPGNPSSVPRERVASWHSSGVLRVLGQVGDMAGLLRQVDLVVLPSYYREGIPRILLEGAASGLPLIAADTPGCRDVVEQGVNGLLVPPRDPGALAAAIRKLAGDPSLRDRMGRAGRARALGEFDERGVVARMLEVYEELMPGALSPVRHL